jgi:hypothetical protein
MAPTPLLQTVVARTNTLAFRAPEIAAGIRLEVDVDTLAVAAARHGDFLDKETRELLHAAENGFDCELDGGRGLAFRCGKPNQDHLPPSSSPSSREFARKSPWKPPSAADAAGQAGGRYKIRTEPPRRHGMEIYAVGPLDQGDADGIRTTPPRYSAKITHKLWGRTVFS